jgi:WD40 repeat protein
MLRVRLSEHDGSRVDWLRFTPSGRLLAGVQPGYSDSWADLREFDPAAGTVRGALVGDRGAVSPDGRWLAAVSYQKMAGVDYLALYDLRAAPLWPRLLADGEFSGGFSYHRAVRPAFDPTGRLLASGGPRWALHEEEPPEVRVHDLATGRERAAVTAAGLLALAFAPSGRTLLAAADGRLDLLDADTLGVVGCCWRAAGPVRELAVSPDGRTVAVASDAGLELVARRADGRPEVRGMLPPATALAFQPDGRLLAAGPDGRVRRWAADRPANGPGTSAR